MPAPDDNMASADHEAGHAVIARGLGVGVTRIAMDSIRTRQRCNDPMASYTQAIICMSGPAAECRFMAYMPDEIEHNWTTVWRNDRSDAERHPQDIDVALHQTGVHHRGQVEELARKWVEEHWATITRVAEALAAQGGLEPSELDRLRQHP
jgi:hypothetical protein